MLKPDSTPGKNRQSFESRASVDVLQNYLSGSMPVKTPMKLLNNNHRQSQDSTTDHDYSSAAKPTLSRAKTPAVVASGPRMSTDSSFGHRRRVSQGCIEESSQAAPVTTREHARTKSQMEIYRNSHDPGIISVEDYVKTSFRDNRHQSELNYPPTDANLKKSIILWKQMPKKTSFLDPLIAREKIKLGPQQYSTHKNWTETTSNSYFNGHAKKGVF